MCFGMDTVDAHPYIHLSWYLFSFHLFAQNDKYNKTTSSTV